MNSIMVRQLDKSLLLTVLFLMGLGLVQVYSSSYMYAIENYADGLFFFKKQLLFTGLALVLMFTVALLPWRWCLNLGLSAWAVALLGVVGTLIPSLGVRAGGAHRWLQLPLGFRFEPAELLRISFPFVISFILQRADTSGRWNWPMKILVFGIPMILLLQQPDFGSLVICTSILLALIFVNGVDWRLALGGIFVSALGAGFLVLKASYRLNRIKAFLDPWSDPNEKGFQVIQSMLSFHSGGLTGVGLGHGQGKLFFLPEAHTDFTLAVLGEETGFLGFLIVLLIYGFLVFRGLQITVRAHHKSDRLIGLGVTLSLAFSIFINVGVVTGFLPTKGLTLPFLSYGGSSLVCTGLAVGWLLSLDRHAHHSEGRAGAVKRL